METRTASVQLAEIISEEWESRLRYDPVFATYTGDHRFNDRLQGVTEDDYERWLDHLLGLCRRLNAIDRAALTTTEQLNADILTRLLGNEARDLEFRAYRLPISKSGGFHLDFAEWLPLVAPFETVKDYENYVARLAAFRRYVEEQIGVMRGGLATGYRPAAVTLAGVDGTLRKQMVIDPAASPLYAPFTRFPESIGGSDRVWLIAEGQKSLQTSVVPGYEALRRFLNDEYVPGARVEVGASYLPNGCEFYQHRIRYFTSLDLSAEQVHDTGQSEVKRIRTEMEESMRAVGFQGGFNAFIDYLRTDPRFYVATPEVLLKETAYVLKRIDGELPRLFKTLPRTPYGIRPIPDASAPGNTAAYYFPATGDGRCAGFYYVNTFDLKSRPLYEIEALSLHEAVPGHHLQLALQQELDLPPFRRFYGFTEFVEGWALYAERLGLEMGFYQDPYSDFGRLSYEMWRACRLVVDTGLHALGWSRQQAIDFMAANTSSTLLNIANEVDRYIAWPGQALAYKIGELKIRELRARAEREFGSSFDLREFHDLLLGSGAVPLDVLERMVDRWIARRGNP